MLLRQLEKDQEAVDQVREIVLSEEAVMKRETEIVQEYADVSSHILDISWHKIFFQVNKSESYILVYIQSICLERLNKITNKNGVWFVFVLI